ncbi:MAG: ROK family protein, partial [Candidatus Nitrosotenuis sp.]
MYRIGVDLGGTKIEGICLDENSQVLKRKRIATNQQNGYHAIVKSIVSLVEELSKDLDDYKIGICTPGAISKKSGLIKNSNTQCLIGMPLKEDLQKYLNQKIAMDNDANCFAMAEATMGAATGYDVVFGVIIGTGVG